MRFGLNGSEWSLIENLVLNPLKRCGAQVWIFGSRANRKHRKFSDIDVLYKAPPHGFPAGFLSRLKESIEESRLSIKVDLVDEAEIAESYRSTVLGSRIEV